MFVIAIFGSEGFFRAIALFVAFLAIGIAFLLVGFLSKTPFAIVFLREILSESFFLKSIFMEAVFLIRPLMEVLLAKSLLRESILLERGFSEGTLLTKGVADFIQRTVSFLLFKGTIRLFMERMPIIIVSFAMETRYPFDLLFSRRRGRFFSLFSFVRPFLFLKVFLFDVSFLAAFFGFFAFAKKEFEIVGRGIDFDAAGDEAPCRDAKAIDFVSLKSAVVYFSRAATRGPIFQYGEAYAEKTAGLEGFFGTFDEILCDV